MEKEKFDFYSQNEIKNLLLNAEKLVYVDNGIDEVVIKYNDLPDFIVDMGINMEYSCKLKVYNFPSESMTPILTTIGYFLDYCDPDVRKDIIERLIKLQTFEENPKKYKIISEDDLEKTQNDIRKNMSVKILNLWLDNYGDIRCNALISINGKEKANIITCFDRLDYPDWKNSQDDYKDEILYNWGNYLYLPKISKCSKLLKEIYDNVCESDATMCHITNEDWKNDYADRYTNKDIENLKKEVKKYHLEDVITFDDREYKIVGWGNLEISFNDDRKLIKNRDLER